MSRPSVTVVMSVLNGLPHLPAAVESVLRQDGCDLEVVIVDDGSTDGTDRVLKDIAASDRRVRVLTNAGNIGLTRSLNRALRHARGRYIARQDADDISRPGRLSAQAAFLEANSHVGAVGCWVEAGADPARPRDLWRTPMRPGEIRYELLFGNCMAHPSVMLRRTLIPPEGLYDEAVRYAQDFVLWHRLSASTNLANLRRPLYFRRVHPAMIGARHPAEQEATVRQTLVRRWSSLLGRPVEESEVAAIRRLERGERLTEGAVAAASRLLELLWRAFLREARSLTAEELKYVRRRHARRLLRLAFRGEGLRTAVAAGFLAHKHDPLAVCRATSAAFSRRR